MTLLAEPLWSLQIRLHPLPRSPVERIALQAGSYVSSSTTIGGSVAPSADGPCVFSLPGSLRPDLMAGSEMLSAVFFPILDARLLNAGACRFASPGSHASHQAAARLGPPGFDPIAREHV